MVIIQAFGILGMIMNVVSYQAKKQKNIIACQLFGSLFFVINMFLLNAITGGLLNIIGVIRAVVYYNKSKLKNIKICNAIFIFLYILSYFATFFVFHKEMTIFNLIAEILPLVAMITVTIAFSKNSAEDIRRMTFISSPLWLIYNCLNFSVGGILCELFSLTSVVTATIRYKNTKKGENKNENAKS